MLSGSLPGARFGKYLAKFAVAENQVAVVGEIGAQLERAHQPQRAVAELDVGLIGDDVAPVGQAEQRLAADGRTARVSGSASSRAWSGHLGDRDDRVRRGGRPDRRIGCRILSRTFHRTPWNCDVKRIGAGDPRAAPRLVDPLPVETLERDESLMGLARQDQIGIELVQDLDGAVEQGVAEPQLGEHQHHGKPDPGTARPPTGAGCASGCARPGEFEGERGKSGRGGEGEGGEGESRDGHVRSRLLLSVSPRSPCSPLLSLFGISLLSIQIRRIGDGAASAGPPARRRCT